MCMYYVNMCDILAWCTLYLASPLYSTKTCSSGHLGLIVAENLGYIPCMRYRKKQTWDKTDDAWNYILR